MDQSNNVLSTLKDKKIAVIGLGIEGVALCDFLIGRVESITVLDKLSPSELKDKVSPELSSKIDKILHSDEIKFHFGSDYLSNLSDFDLAFRSPSVYFADSQLKLAEENGTKISSQISLFFDLCPCQIIGVTGTKGKGTTASLLTEIISEKFESTGSGTKVYLAGNIGYPAITLIPELSADDLVVLELSNFQLADLTKSPHLAIVTNLSVDHLDYHKTKEEYHLAKASIVRYQTESDFVVLNDQSTFSNDVLKNVKSKKYYFSNMDSVSASAVVVDRDGHDTVVLDPNNRNITICNEKNIKLLGRHNLENIAAASLAADILGIESTIISSVAKKFVGLTHRLEMVKEIHGVKYINDSFATNPEPTIAAVKSFREPKILILGGSEKGADFDELGRVIANSNVKAAILIGVEKTRIQKSLLAASFAGTIILPSGNIDTIVSQAQALAAPGDVVIFSPACASFDMFKNYKERGDKFKAAVFGLSDK